MHNSFRTVQTAPSELRGYFPIPPADLAETFTSPIIAIGAGNIHARATWFVGCNLFQQIEIQGFTSFQSERLTVPINRPPTIFRLPIVVPSYRLSLEVPFWHLEISLSIWQYVGEL